MRVLHLPTAVGGGPSGLSHQLKLLGIDSHVWSIEQNYLNYPVDRVLTDAHEPIVVQALKVFSAGRYLFGPWDVIHFNYGSTLFSNGGRLLAMRPAAVKRQVIARLITALLGGIARVMQRLELGILRARGIPVFVTYQGSDARQDDYSREHFEINIASQMAPDPASHERDEWKRRQIALMSKHAAKIYAVNPDLLHVLPVSAEFVPYGHVSVKDWRPSYTPADREYLRIAHAPSNRAVKGTDLILAAVADLKAEGYKFEFELIEGVSNEEALARYRAVDVVIDQLYAGWYGGIAVEAMALGKPVVVYLREPDLHYLPPGMKDELPFFRATPSTIRAALKEILDMPRTDLIATAKLSRAFVEKWHDPVKIAAKIAADYRQAQESMTSVKRKSGSR